MNTIVLEHIRWETYEHLVDDAPPGARLTFDHGLLEIEMSPLPEHEAIKALAESLLMIILDEREQDYVALGSTTFKRALAERGAEPDACFYLRALDRLPRDPTHIDPNTQVPDLVIEIDVTSPSLEKDGLYAALGVAELWRYHGGAFDVLVLSGNVYAPGASAAVAGVDGAVLTRLIAAGRAQPRTAWRRTVRAWARGEEADETVREERE